jgi:hypothetical protein
MALPYPRKLNEAGEAYAPLVHLLKDTLIRPRELAERWRYDDDHLANLRRRNVGVPWLRLPTATGKTDKPSGAIRYRLSEIVAAEISGMGGALSLERVCLVISSCEFLSDVQRAAVIAKLNSVLGGGK